jgi:hypothetical protein
MGPLDKFILRDNALSLNDGKSKSNFNPTGIVRFRFPAWTSLLQ